MSNWNFQIADSEKQSLKGELDLDSMNCNTLLSALREENEMMSYVADGMGVAIS